MTTVGALTMAAALLAVGALGGVFLVIVGYALASAHRDHDQATAHRTVATVHTGQAHRPQ